MDMNFPGTKDLPCFIVLGLNIADPFTKLKKKFGIGTENAPFALYDGYRTPAERADEANVNVLELEDLLITVAMNSKIGALAMISVWKGIKEDKQWYRDCNSLLAQLDPKLDLADADGEQLKIIHRLFETLGNNNVKGVGYGVAGKILCRKRPRSVPMLDSWMLPLACHFGIEDEERVVIANPRPWAQLQDIGRALRFFRKLCCEGRQQLDGLCQSFHALPENPDLSLLRAAEALLWWECSQQREQADPRIGNFRKIMGWEKQVKANNGAPRGGVGKGDITEWHVNFRNVL